MKSTSAVVLIVSLTSSTDVSGAEESTGSRAPNIVFIMADDLGYGHLGCYGQTKIKTPRIDRMAREGTRFTQVYAGNSVCAPSRSVLMTGLHSGNTSVRINGGGAPLQPRDVTIAEVLKKAGYVTGLFGKWGLGDDGSEGVPTRQGFDEFYGYLHQVHAHFYYPCFLWSGEKKQSIPENFGEKHGKYSQDLIVEAALDFLRGHKEQRFFLYLPSIIPHFELLVPEDFLEPYKGKFPEPYPYKDERRHYADQASPRAALAGMISRLDRDVGRVLDLLEKLGLDEKTVVFFTSDNGGYVLDRENFFRANGPLRGGKGSLFEGGIRVPMIVRWPGRVRASHTDDFVWTFWDVLPTVAELAGAKVPEGLDGISVAPRLLGTDQKEPRRFLYWDRVFGWKGGPPRSQAVRIGDWKAIRRQPRQPLELYNLATDIGETKDVSAGNPEVVREVEEFLLKAVTPCRSYPFQEPSWGWDRLRTGYVK